MILFIRMLRALLFYGMMLILSSCGGGDDDNGSSNSSSQSSPATNQPTPSTPTPSTSEIQEDLSTGLKGTDTNANGIRDDIDKLIAQKFSYTPEVKHAGEQKARALQQFMETTTKEDALRAAEQLMRSTSCVFKVLSDPVGDYDKRQALSREIEAWTANTKERLSKYLKSNELVGGAYFTQPVEPVCD